MPLSRTPFTDVDIARRIIDQAVAMTAFTQAPLIKRLGLNNESRWDFVNWPPGGTKKVEWLEDGLAPNTTTLTANISSTSATTMTVADGTRLKIGHVVQINNEYMTVENVAGNTITIARGAGGTTATTHANGDVVTIHTIAKRTMEDWTIGYTTNMTIPYNYTQILEESIRVAGDQAIAVDYGVPDTMKYHLAKLIGGSERIGEKGRAGTLILKLAKTFYAGRRQQPSDSQRGMMGGAKTFITKSLGDVNTPLSRPLIHQALREVYEDGAMPDILVCSPWGAEVIASLYDQRQYTQESTTGGETITRIRTPVVDSVEVVVDWMCPPTEMYVLDSERVGWCTVRPFMVKPWPENGDYMARAVIGEYTFVVKNGSTAHRIIYHKGSA